MSPRESAVPRREMVEYVFVDGDWRPKEEARISVFDHGLLYGDGVYEGLRAYGGRVFMIEAHLQRLKRSARCLGIDVPKTAHEITTLIERGMERNNVSNAYIRLLVTRGTGPIGPDPTPCCEPQLIVMVRDIPPLHGQRQGGIRVALASVRRCGVDSATAQIKSLNYLPTILGKREANRMGVDDVILLDPRGFVAEAPVANVFIVRDGDVLTPSRASGILEGVTRAVVMDLLSEAGVQVFEKDLTPYDLSVAEEMFLTGTHAEIVPVEEYNGAAVGNSAPGPLTMKVLEMFREATRHSSSA